MPLIPGLPEFPPERPRFPATRVRPLKNLGYDGSVLVKDEGVNRRSGTHKDRMAWEVVVSYRNLRRAAGPSRELPRFSLISSGSAAIAIGRMLREYKYPKLIVALDRSVHDNPAKTNLLQAIRGAHCEVHPVDLEAKEYKSEEVLRLTHNPGGIDLTEFQNLTRDIVTYDWLSYEILSLLPDYIFVPYGSGKLFEEILHRMMSLLSIDTSEYGALRHRKKLRKCNVIGATTDNASSLADKLYSPFNPARSIHEAKIGYYKMCGFCGVDTAIHIVSEKSLERACEIMENEDIRSEPSGAAGLALFLELLPSIPRKKRVVIVNTGKLRREMSTQDDADN